MRWRPFASRRRTVAPTLRIPVCHVVALEALQGLCDRHNGIAAIKGVWIVLALLYTRFWLAIVMVLAAEQKEPINFALTPRRRSVMCKQNWSSQVSKLFITICLLSPTPHSSNSIAKRSELLFPAIFGTLTLSKPSLSLAFRFL